MPAPVLVAWSRPQAFTPPPAMLTQPVIYLAPLRGALPVPLAKTAYQLTQVNVTTLIPAAGDGPPANPGSPDAAGGGHSRLTLDLPF